MNPLAFIGRLFTSDITPEERIVLWKLAGRRGWHFVLVVFISFAMGWLGPLGLPGFARSGQMEKLEASVQSIKDESRMRRLNELPGAIIDMTKKYCAASGDLRTQYELAMLGLRKEYLTLAGHEFFNPTCIEVLR